MPTPEVLRAHIYKQLQDIFADIREAILFDYPTHLNIGDLLIWLGELTFLDTLGIQVSGQFHIGNSALDQLHDLIANKTLLLHGGGNFGDLYPWHHNLRTGIIQRFSSNRIIMFPQTMYYTNKPLLQRDIDIYSRHPNLCLMWRDKVSYELGISYFPKNCSFLVPDMAFCLDVPPFTSLLEERKGMLFLRRTDKERSREKTGLCTKGISCIDWKDLTIRNLRRESSKWPIFRRARRYLLKQLARGFGAKHYIRMCGKENETYLQIAGQCYAIACSEFYKYEMILSDRLHGHILASLLRIPNVLLDNSYGKNRQYYDTWTKDDKISRFSEGMGEISEHIDELRQCMSFRGFSR